MYYSRDEFKSVLTYNNGGFKSLRYILGIVSQEKIIIENKSTLYEVESKVTQMDIAVVINASYIKELINDLKLTK